MLKNLIFDLGNVLIWFIPEELVSRYTDDKEDQKLLLEKLLFTENWKNHDIGLIDEQELYEETTKVLPEHLHRIAEEIIWHWHDRLDPIEGSADLVKEMKEKGFHLYLLSNAWKDAAAYWHRVPGSEYFDGIVISAFEKCIKPEPKIFEILLDRYELKAEECLFIDDVPANVEGAKRVNMDAFLFHNNHDELREYIAERMR